MKLVDKQKIFFLVLFLGFLIGILYTNLLATDYMKMTGVFSTYYLQKFLECEYVVGEYLMKVLYVRIFPLLVLFMMAYSRINKIGVLLFLTWTGFIYGIYMSLGVVQLGFVGVVLCVVGLLPQMIFYVPAYLIVLIYTYQRPESQWNTMKICVVILCMISGIVLECQINPQILRWIITKI